jgi:TrmH family RNA methyltransferase
LFYHIAITKVIFLVEKTLLFDKNASTLQNIHIIYMTKAEKKHIKQLQQKKYRNEFHSFIVEGWKSINDFIDGGYIPEMIYATTENAKYKHNFALEIISKKELESISLLKNPKDALAVFFQKDFGLLPQKDIILALDNLQDPGNLGTIIRTADWFGIKNIVCSQNTVDCYNPKVVQATMGSLANVNIIYTDLQKYLKATKLPVLGTFLQGKNVDKITFSKDTIIVIGNEGNGISKEIEAYITQKITIAKHPDANAESLNAAIATAVVLSKLAY